jgi:GDPmannose 4,6-dehydratase
MKRALIIGITGQDGSYLSEFLLGEGYEVHGLLRRTSVPNTQRIDKMLTADGLPNERIKLHFGDLSDSSSLRTILEKTRPHEVYNLGAQSHVKVSFDAPEYTGDVVALGTLRLLEAIRGFIVSSGQNVKMYQAGSSEMFGAAPPPQNEDTAFYPRSPYAVSKIAGYWYGINYREAYGMFICNGILFNHESPRRGETFVTRKITRAVGRIKYGLQNYLYLGNLDSRRDWGHAADYVRAMWLMLQQKTPGDYVISTGEAHSVREFVELAFERAGLRWEDHVRIDPELYRPTEVDYLLGDSSRARGLLGWNPSCSFNDLVAVMVDSDMELARIERLIHS